MNLGLVLCLRHGDSVQTMQCSNEEGKDIGGGLFMSDCRRSDRSRLADRPRDSFFRSATDWN